MHHRYISHYRYLRHCRHMHYSSDITGTLLCVLQLCNSMACCHICRECFFTMESTAFKSRCMSQLNNSLGAEGCPLRLTIPNFPSFCNFWRRKQEETFQFVRLLPSSENRWTAQFGCLGRNCIDGEGQVVPEDECAYMWLDDTINETLSTISLEEVLPHIVIPLDTSVLHRCISEMDVLSTKCCYYFNYIIQAGGSASDSDATQFFPFPHDVCRDSFGSA